MKSVQFRFTLYGGIAILFWSCLLGIARLIITDYVKRAIGRVDFKDLA